MATNKPYIANIEPFLAAGINPKTGLPNKFGSSRIRLKQDIKQFLRLIDEQDAVNRYVWYNLPCNITSAELERMLYYKGQLCFFYNEDLDQFYFMPYALDGTIDFYGRFNRVHPVPMTSGTDDKAGKAQAELLSEIKLDCVYGVLTELPTYDQFVKSTVLLHDYTKQLSQIITPRQTVNDSLLDTMAECVPFMRTNLIASTGITGYRVPDSDAKDEVNDANRLIEEAALVGDMFVPMVGKLEFQGLTDKNLANSQDYMLALQALDNLRLSGYGIDNGGLFEKKAHVLQAEEQLNGGPVGLVLQDGLSIRQNFCNIVNSIWGLGIWCEPSETITNLDTNGDGVANEDRSSNNENGGVENNGNNSDNDSAI